MNPAIMKLTMIKQKIIPPKILSVSRFHFWSSSTKLGLFFNLFFKFATGVANTESHSSDADDEFLALALVLELKQK